MSSMTTRSGRHRGRMACGAMALLALLCPWPAAAQASLAAEDIIDEVVVKIGEMTYRFTVIRDAINKEQWYYAPDQPRLAERLMSSGKREPEFALVRYQFKDPANPEQLAEGGFLQFAITLALPPEAQPQMKAAIAKYANMPPDSIRLAALPFKDATVHLYIPKTGMLVASEPIGPGIAPTFATQKMTFAIPLTKIGSDVYDTIANGTTGLAAGVEFTYIGLTPPTGFTVEVDWDMAYAFFSKDEKARAEVSVMGMFGAKASGDRNKLVDTLKQQKVLRITQIEPGQAGEQALQLILARINQEMLAAATPPASVAEASASEPQNPENAVKRLQNKIFGTVGYSVAIKDRRVTRTGKETVTFVSRKLQDRKTLASGFVGIGAYPDDVRQRLVTIVPPGPWKSAFFVLPNVGDAQEIGVSQVDLEIRLRNGDTTHATQVAVWKPATGWRGIGGTNADPRSLVAFGLMDLYAKDPLLKDVRFETATQVTLRNDVLRVTDTLPVDDQRAIVTPLSAVKVVRVDASSLSWSGLVPESELVSATVAVRAGDKSFNTLIKPRLLDAAMAPPAAVNWVVPRNVPVIATVTFRLKDGRTINWSQNGRNLSEGQESSGNLFLELIDADWKRPGSNQ
jgi:hypothetical protein